MSRTVTTTASRPLDHLYDPTFATSGPRDHAAATARAAQYNYVRAPVYENMFSDNMTAPRAMVVAKRSNAVPAVVDTSFHAPGLSAAEARSVSSSAAVTGTQRHKFFRQAVVPSLGATNADDLLAATREANPAVPQVPQEAAPAVRTVAVQTMYRESEAQTDPYSPDVEVPAGENPELLALESFKWGHGLPATLAEIEMIERAREKREWERQLPPLDDPSQLARRQKMMEAMEESEWAEREAEIGRLQQRRLDLLRTIIETREDENEAANDARVRAVYDKKMREKEGKLEKIERARIKALRKLGDKRAAQEKTSTHRDIIGEYADFGSDVYAPKTMQGTRKDRRLTATLPTEPLNTHKLDKLQAIESLASRKLNTQVRLPQRDAPPRTPAERKRAKVRAQLETMASVLEAKKTRGTEERVPLTCTHRVEKPPPRPKTPEITQPDVAAEDLDLACVELQRLVRGRAVQNRMFEGKERRLPLINELRTVHGVSPEEREAIDAATDRVLEARQSIVQLRRNEETIEATVDSIQGEIVAQTLDFLASELVRLREERRIAAMVALAGRERTAREEAESVRRGAEELRRSEEDEMWRQAMRVHEGTAFSLLNDVFAEAVDNTAARQAMHEARLKAGKLNTIVDHIEGARDPPEVIVRDLVASFLFPEVERRTLRQEVELKQRRFLDAAGPVVRSAMEEERGGGSD